MDLIKHRQWILKIQRLQYTFLDPKEKAEKMWKTIQKRLHFKEIQVFQAGGLRRYMPTMAALFLLSMQSSVFLAQKLK